MEMHSRCMILTVNGSTVIRLDRPSRRRCTVTRYVLPHSCMFCHKHTSTSARPVLVRRWTDASTSGVATERLHECRLECSGLVKVETQ